MKLRLIAYVKAEQTGEKLKLKLDNGYIIKDSQGLLSILGFGSILSGKIAQKYIELSGNGGVATQLIDGFSGLTSHEILASFEDQQATIQKYVGEQIQKALKEKKVPIVSGYIPGINGTVRSAQSRYNQRAVNVLVNAVEGSGHTLRT